MAMLRASVFLLIGCVAVLTNAHDDLPVIDPTDGMPSQVSAVPTCAADYPRMSQKQPKIVQKALPYPAAVCVKPDNTGDFVAALWIPRTFVYMFDNCGWVKKRIELPAGTSYSCGCAFTNSKLFYAATRSRKIYQFNINGTFEKVFAIGYNFLRMTTRGQQLYVSIESTKNVRVYDTANGNLVRQFSTTTANARGLAFDPAGYLHVSTWGKTVEIFTHDGYKVKEMTYPQLVIADGLLIDSNTYTIITDRVKKQVQIYRPYSNLLVKRMTGFGLPIDVGMGYKCGYLLVADYYHGIYLL